MVAPTEPYEQAQEPVTPEVSASQQTATEKGPTFSRLGEDLRNAAAEFGAYARYLASVQVDRARHLARRAVFLGILGVVGLILAVALLTTGACLFLIGVAGLIGALFNNYWLGATLVGLLTILLPPLAIYLAMKAVAGRAIGKLKAKYADIRAQQKVSFGRDIEEVARG